jgi:hypothetical protein
MFHFGFGYLCSVVKFVGFLLLICPSHESFVEDSHFSYLYVLYYSIQSLYVFLKAVMYVVYVGENGRLPVYVQMVI